METRIRKNERGQWELHTSRCDGWVWVLHGVYKTRTEAREEASRQRGWTADRIKEASSVDRG